MEVRDCHAREIGHPLIGKPKLLDSQSPKESLGHVGNDIWKRSDRRKSNNIRSLKMTLEEFSKEIKSTGITVCYFSHDECSVCKVLRPKIEEIVQNTPSAQFLYINTLENPQISGQNMVFAVPAIIVFFDGREAKRYSRNISLTEFKMFLERFAGQF